ncbi:MAG: phosphodiester glycosidase family protein [Bacilli bacterium]|nr:phosphodiester glycosidase family protein [Bacilli bacterium]MDD4808968.1 phosphodiester glycosidase family protein [Bacilli bacterium]
MRKSTIILIVLDVLALIGFFLTYGPISYFRNFLVTTAMNTTTHQYLAYIFYNDEMITDILSKNYFIEIDEDVNLDDIVIDTKPKDNYDNKYDEQILERDPGNNDYKIIDIKIGRESGFVVAIYDPSKVKLIAKEQLGTKHGERTIDMCRRDGGIVCINGGSFKDEGWGSGIPTGILIKNKKILWDDGGVRQIIGFNTDNKLVLLDTNAEDAIQKHKIRDALSYGPNLIVNGKTIKIVGDPYGMAPRVAIGQRKDGIVLFVIMDGTYANVGGTSLQELTDILVKYGAHNAANLDGGTSTTLVVNNKIYNNLAVNSRPYGRYIVSGFGLIP